LHGDEGLPFEFVDVVDCTNVGMIEGGGRLSFALETLQGLAILGQCFRQELEHDEPTELGVLGLIDHTHPTATQLLKNAVVGNRLANHGFEAGKGKLETRSGTASKANPKEQTRVESQCEIENPKSESAALVYAARPQAGKQFHPLPPEPRDRDNKQ